MLYGYGFGYDKIGYFASRYADRSRWFITETGISNSALDYVWTKDGIWTADFILTANT